MRHYSPGLRRSGLERERERQNFRFGRSNFFFLDALSLLTTISFSSCTVSTSFCSLCVCVASSSSSSWSASSRLSFHPSSSRLVGLWKGSWSQTSQWLLLLFLHLLFFSSPFLYFVDAIGQKRVLEEESESVPRVSSFPPPTMTLQHLIPGKSFEWPPPNGAR